MNKNTFYIVVIIGLLISNLVMLTFTIRPVHKERPRHDGPKKMIVKRLNFDENQIKEFELLIMDHRATIKDLDSQIRASKAVLYEHLNKNSANPIVDSLAGLISAAHTKIELAHFRHFIAIKDLCNEEQLDNFDELSKELERIFAPKRRHK